MKPSWDRLFRIADAQEGHFTTAQAARAGYSPQLLRRHLLAGRIRRVRRSIYRLVHYPEGDHGDLVALWLWAGGAGVYSHRTALVLHGLAPESRSAPAHLTLPSAWAARRRGPRSP